MARLRIVNALVFVLICLTLPHRLSECLSSFGSSSSAEGDSMFFTMSNDNATEEITSESNCFISMADVFKNRQSITNILGALNRFGRSLNTDAWRRVFNAFVMLKVVYCLPP